MNDLNLEAIMKAAESGDPEAQFRLGCLFDSGRLVRQDAKQAAHWYGRAAESGHPHGQFNYAEVLREGAGVAQSSELAFERYEKAALQGHARAQYNLAMMYATGEGVAASVGLAYVWLELARDGDASDIEAAQAVVSGHLKEEDIEMAAQLLATLRPVVPPHPNETDRL